MSEKYYVAVVKSHTVLHGGHEYANTSGSNIATQEGEEFLVGEEHSNPYCVRYPYDDRVLEPTAFFKNVKLAEAYARRFVAGENSVAFWFCRPTGTYRVCEVSIEYEQVVCGFNILSEAASNAHQFKEADHV